MQRKRTSPSVAAASKKAQHSITIDEQMKITEKHEEGMPLMTITEEFGQPVSKISTVLKDKEDIKSAAVGTINLKMMIVMKKHESLISEIKKTAGKIEEGLYQQRLSSKHQLDPEKREIPLPRGEDRTHSVGGQVQCQSRLVLSIQDQAQHD